MTVFTKSSHVTVWGPTASVNVRINALSSVVDKTWMLSNVQVGAREITDIRQCFNDVSYIYALGNNQASCVITLVFAIMVGRKNCSGSENFAAIKKGLSDYKSWRISKRKKSSITIGGFSANGWLTGIDIGSLDPLRGICYGTVHFNMEL